MIRFKKYSDLSFSSYFAITNYVALVCSLLCLFLPMLINHTRSTHYNLIDIISLNYSSINVLAILLIFCTILIFILNMFFQPSWLIYFINVAMIIYLFVSPVLINFKLLPLLNLHQTSLTLYIGGIFVMISAMLYTCTEIYKVSILDVYVNRNIKEKKQKLINEFTKSRRYRLCNKKDRQNTENKPIKQKHKYHIRRNRIKTKTKYKKSKLIKTQDYIKHLDTIYKI